MPPALSPVACLRRRESARIITRLISEEPNLKVRGRQRYSQHFQGTEGVYFVGDEDLDCVAASVLRVEGVLKDLVVEESELIEGD